MAVINKVKIEQYAEYKDSGVEWLGEIPKEWSTIKIKFISSIYNGDSLNERKKSNFESFDEEDLPYISSKDITLETSEIQYSNGLRIPKAEIGYKVAKSNSSLICIEGGSAGRKIAFTNQDVCFVNKLACINVNNKFHAKFIYHTLKGGPFQKQFKLSLSGLIGGVAISAIKNFYVLLPPLKEQTAIANFLDRKTTLIDQAIEIKTKQIELLQERRQILIHRAVTRGLNPAAKMKDSGVEWIGEVPEGWEVLRNAALFSERNESGNEDLPILSVSIHTAVSAEEISDEKNIRGKVRSEDKSKYKKVEVGDITFNMMRAWQGAIGAVRIKGMVSPAYIVAKKKRAFNPDFIEYLFRTETYIQEISRFSRGITDFRKRLYWQEFKNLSCLLPPIKEQNEIVNFIQRSDIKIEKVIRLQEGQIEKLKEYKSTLINSAVTGKIKVG